MFIEKASRRTSSSSNSGRLSLELSSKDFKVMAKHERPRDLRLKLELGPIMVDSTESRNYSLFVEFDSRFKVTKKFEVHFIEDFIGFGSNIRQFRQFANFRDYGQIILHFG